MINRVLRQPAAFTLPSIVAFRSAKGRSFAERKTTLAGWLSSAGRHRNGQVSIGENGEVTLHAACSDTSWWLGQKLAALDLPSLKSRPASNAPVATLPGHRRGEVFAANRASARGSAPATTYLTFEYLNPGDVTYVVRAFLIAALLVWPALAEPRPRASAAEPPAAASRPDESEQLRGPVHEAFAQPLVDVEASGVNIDRRPSAAWHEMPSVVKPASASAIWIPGYWAWDPAEKDLLWVPGIWRIPPPGMRWVPGYWNERDDGWRWVGGFWSPLDQPRLRYLPPPPPPNDRSPAPPSDGRFAVAGHWTYVTGRYVWNDGFSAAHKKGWVWTPSHYVNTPRGALLLPGYWDYPLDARGLLFAPARGATPATSFTPSVAVNLGELPEALFAGARFGHFYFGDYFDGGGDVKPWYEPNATSGLDPLFAYERWRHQLIDAEWGEKLAERYRHRRDNIELRPSLRMIGGQAPLPAEGNAPRLGIWISDLARGRDRSRGVTELGKEAQRRVAQNAESFKLLAVQRAKFESSGEAAGRDKPVAFYLPVPVEPLDPDRSVRPERAPTTGQFVPGVAGRRVPGTRDRTLPGTSGRTLPGVDSNIPGALGPGTASPPRR